VVVVASGVAVSERTTAEDSVLESMRAAADAVASSGCDHRSMGAAMKAIEQAMADVEMTFVAHRMVRRQCEDLSEAVRGLKRTLQRERGEKRTESRYVDDALAEASASRLIQAMEVSSRLPTWFMGMRRDGSRLSADVLLRADDTPVVVPVVVRPSRSAAHRLRVTLPSTCAVVAVTVEDDADDLVVHAVSEIASAARALAERADDGQA
jgi:hypothetical protein